MSSTPTYRVLRNLTLTMPARAGFVPIICSLQLPTYSSIEIDDNDTFATVGSTFASSMIAIDTLNAVTRYSPGMQIPIGQADELVRMTFPLRSGEAVPGRLEWRGHISSVQRPKAQMGTFAMAGFKVTMANRPCWIPGLPPVTQPLNLTATPGKSGARRFMTLNWSQVVGATSYQVWRGNASGAEVLVATSSTVSFLDTGLLPGKNYYYYVAAQNDGSTSAPSNEAAATTEPNVRPNPLVLSSLRYYFPLDRRMEVYGLDAWDSVAGTGRTSAGGAMTAEVTAGPSPTAVPGHYDWAQHGATTLRLDNIGSGGQRGNYPTGAWTASFGGWFQDDIGGVFNVLHRMYSGGQGQVWIRKNGNKIEAYGYTSIGGHYLFPANDSPTYAFQQVGTYPDDGLPHQISVVMTQDSAGTGGGVITVFIDGIAQAPVTGRTGMYFANDQLYNFAGGTTVAMSDLWMAEYDATADIPALAA